MSWDDTGCMDQASVFEFVCKEPWMGGAIRGEEPKISLFRYWAVLSKELDQHGLTFPRGPFIRHFMGGFSEEVVEDIGDLKGEDLRLHTRITDEGKVTNQRIDRVNSTYKYITAGFLGLSAIGGVLVAIFG